MQLSKYITKQNSLIGSAGVLTYASLILLTSELCLFQGILGLPCPSCGMTRAYINLFQGDIKEAFFYHPLFWLVPIIFAVLIFKSKVAIFAKLSSSKIFWAIVGALILGVYVYRLITYFPQYEPVDFNENAILPTIYRILFTN